MAFDPAVEEFLNRLRRSGLLDEKQVAAVVDGLAKAGADFSDPKKVAAALVQNETLTKWQAENLLRGKRRGFVLGKYRLLGLLGRGNSSVYEAEHSLMRRRCAIKILPAKNSSSSAAALARFQQEAKAVATLDHSNIVRAYDLGQDKDGKTVIHYFAMELVDGESFEERVARKGPLTAYQAIVDRGLWSISWRSSCALISSRPTMCVGSPSAPRMWTSSLTTPASFQLGQPTSYPRRRLIRRSPSTSRRRFC